jgi:oxygen-independent coproporphyrinogen-3 oxidase
MRAWREAGVSRLSVGAQSFDDGVLTTLDRGYTAAEALAFCRSALEAGFPSVNIDLMIGVPGETREPAARTLEEVTRLAPDHVAVYMLENVEGLPFEKTMLANPVEEDEVADIYRMCQAGLESAGLLQYEISNFARQGKEALHNLKYWRYEPFLGLGPSACSHLGEKRWCNKRDLGEWARALRLGESVREEVVELTPAGSAKEALIFGLRLVAGVDLSALSDRFGVDLESEHRSAIDELTVDGWLIREGSVIRIPRGRFLVANHVFSRFV